MASVWLVLVVPWIHMIALIKEVEVSSCAKVHTLASVLPLGSPISASCSIKDGCPLTKRTDNWHVEWKLNKHFLPSNFSYQESNGTHGVRIPSYTDTSADIACCVCVEDDCQVVGGVRVNLGYPPAVPQNLSCALNVSTLIRMGCQWDPGQETENILTRYILHSSIKRRTSEYSFQYVLPPHVHTLWIPRSEISLLSEMEFYVTAVSALGNSTSARLLLHPLKSAKFNPPEIQRVEAHKFGCLKYSWCFKKPQQWLKMTFSVELSLTTVESQLDKELVFQFNTSTLNAIQVCGLLHGTNYRTKMRVRYSSGPWSEWSEWKANTTRIKAPTGRLHTWLKIQDNNETAQLYWKPSPLFRANGWNISYIVESKRPMKTLCVTQESFCSFFLIKTVRKIYLRATNAAGSSNRTEVPVYRKKGLGAVSNFSVRPHSETSLLITWERPVSSLVTGYVLEWRSLIEKEAAILSFALMDKNNLSTVVTGIKPYKPYEISIYPKYVGRIGPPVTVTAYSSEKAPSMAPEWKNWKFHHSKVKLSWDEIPLEQRNGIVRRYTVYFWDDRGNIQVEETNQTHVWMNVKPKSTYKGFLEVHTMGGSFNGSVTILKSENIDGIEMVFIVIPACIVLSFLMIITGFTCFRKNDRLKMCVWPIIPDPANSSIKRWTTTESLQGMPPFKEDKDPVLVYLSHFSLLDLSGKEQCKSDYVKENLWSHDSGSHVEGHDSLQAFSSYNSEQDRDSIPYATVVFGGPYQSQPAPPPVYLRSESTQPLLGVEDPGSPPPYENMPRRGSVSEVNHFTTVAQDFTENEENEAILEDFPMLRSMEFWVTDHI
ncbi:granulocyte colony-stimulating factor receptor-like [Myxocyprinus asiaticus]|uniref:granulocyte colony-stimulating factor receptor-like n=1 Tax=Myxocyprinus asiaticus TaxID=70543 RepID=UPI0022217314|nr:granulocyte colony-stimulating factor receptor-like [Myxocyprinus asiaticus]